MLERNSGGRTGGPPPRVSGESDAAILLPSRPFELSKTSPHEAGGLAGIRDSSRSGRSPRSGRNPRRPTVRARARSAKHSAPGLADSESAVLPLDDLPKTRGSPGNRTRVDGVQHAGRSPGGTTVRAKRGASEAQCTLRYRLRAECSALELETPLEFDEHEFVVEFHGAVVPFALASEGTPFSFDPRSHGMELECLLLLG